MYDHDIEEGTPINEFRIDNGKSFVRFKQGNVALSANINRDFFKKKSNKNEEGDKEEDKAKDSKYLGIPWNFNLTYSFNYSQTWNNTTALFEPKYTQTLNVGGDLQVTDKWKVNFQTGWDFQAEKIASTNLGISRDLHCWEMRMNWIPFGQLQSYYFQINVKSSIFEGVKYQMQETVRRTEF